MSGLSHDPGCGRGFFVSFEGTEGGGKSTQIALLAERCRQSGLKVRALREPGGTDVGEEIRHILKHSHHAMTSEAELLLMNASRAQLVREVIRPALAAGELVLCDRFADSTVAYQGYGRLLDPSRVQAVIDFAVSNTWPDLTFLLSVPLDLSERRRADRSTTSPPSKDRFEELDRGFFERVEAGFRDIAARHPERVRVIDAARSVEQVHEEIWRQLTACLTQRAVRHGLDATKPRPGS